MNIELSDVTMRRIEEVVALDLTSQIDVFRVAEDTLRMELRVSGNNSVEIGILLGDLDSERLRLELVEGNLQKLRDRVS